MTDILEFLGLLNSSALCADPSLQSAVLGAWSLSLVQFSLVLTTSRSRKMRIAVATKILLSTNRPDIRQVFSLQNQFKKNNKLILRPSTIWTFGRCYSQWHCKTCPS